MLADTIDEHTSNAKIYGYTIILGAGVGCFCQAGFAVAQMKVKPEEIAYSVGFMTSGQMLASSPSVTSPMTEAFGATNTSLPTIGCVSWTPITLRWRHTAVTPQA